MTEGTGFSEGRAAAPERVVYVQSAVTPKRGVFHSILVYVGSGLVVFSILMNLVLLSWLPVLTGAGEEVQEKYVSGSIASANKVAIVAVTGLIAEGEDGVLSRGGNLEQVLSQLKKAQKDDKVKGVVLEVNSPGGSVTASDVILNEVVHTQKAGKRVVVWMGSVAASGGYYISCKADAIYAGPATLTGSIGVILNLYNVEGLSDKVGVKPLIIKRGEFKDMGSPFRGMTDAERKKFEALADSAFAQFKQVVAVGRKLTDKQVELIADGSILSGEEAVQKGLVDKLGYLEDAITDAKGKYSDAAVVRYQRAAGLLSALLSTSGAPSRDVRVYIESPLPRLAPGLHYVWMPGVAVRP